MSQYAQYQHPYATAYAGYTYPQQYAQPQQQYQQQQYQQQQQQYQQQQQAAQQQAYYQQQAQQLNFPTFAAGSTPGPATAAQLQPPSRSTSTRPHTPQPHRRHTSAGHHHHSAHHRTTHSNQQQQQQYNTAALVYSNSASQKQPGRSSTRRRPAVSGVTNAVAPLPVQSVPSIQRARTYSGGTTGERPRLGSIRSRTNSAAARELPTMMSHIFLTIKAPDMLEVNNVVHPDLLTRVEAVCKDWPRAVHFDRTEYDLIAKFTGRPFSATGPDSYLVQRMIIGLFLLFGHEGYVSLTSVHNGSGFAAPRLVFVRNAPDVTCKFFCMSISDRGVTFVGAQRELIENLALTLNGIFRKTFEDQEIQTDVISILRRPGYHVNRDHFFAILLKYFNDACLKLDASVSLGRSGFFGFGPRQEIWVFKGSDLWQPGEKRDGAVRY